MQNITQNAPLILASQSPRRRQLLKQAGIAFSVVPSRFEEAAAPITAPADYAELLAQGKAAEVAQRYPAYWVLGADTIVVIDGAILGKPASPSEAGWMLRRLSGKVHQVLTGYCICCLDCRHSFSEVITTNVYFKELTTDEIDWYIQTNEPFGKAGAYAIQDIGAFLVKKINGSYTNVVGLPICEVISYLLRQKIIDYTCTTTRRQACA